MQLAQFPAGSRCRELDTQAVARLNPSIVDVEQSVGIVFACEGWLRDHVLQARVVVPGAAFVEAALAAATTLCPSDTKEYVQVDYVQEYVP